MVVVCLFLLALVVGVHFYHQRERKRMSRALIKKNEELKKVANDLNFCTEKQFSYRDDIADLKLNVSNITKEKEKVDSILSEVSNQYETKISNISSNNKKLSSQILSSGEEIRNLRVQLQEKDEVNNSLVEANNELMRKISDIKKVNASLVSSAGGYEKSNIQLREQLKEMTDKHNNNVRLYNELNEEYENVLKELEELEKTDKVGYDEPVYVGDDLLDESKEYSISEINDDIYQKPDFYDKTPLEEDSCTENESEQQVSNTKKKKKRKK